MQVLYSCSRGIWVNRAISKGQFALFFFLVEQFAHLVDLNFLLLKLSEKWWYKRKTELYTLQARALSCTFTKTKKKKKKKQKEFPIFSHSGNFVSKFAAPREMPIISPTSAKSLLLSFLLLCRYLTLRWVAQLFRLPTQLWCNSFMLGKVLL